MMCKSFTTVLLSSAAAHKIVLKFRYLQHNKVAYLKSALNENSLYPSAAVLRQYT